MALPETTEEPYHGFSSWRIKGKVFVTVPDDEHLHVILDEEEIHAAVSAFPQACEVKMWGQKVGALKVSLGPVQDDVLASFITAAWRRRAPKKLIAAYDSV